MSQSEFLTTKGVGFTSSNYPADKRDKYRKPVFQSRARRAFAKDRGIAAGDVLFFLGEQDPFHRTQYRVALCKPHLFP
ncbi:Hypothetical predicted protein [Prunus dulcis]|uniref:Uncharacterized protein n=1 Tax=Prunus dulcis TaxID=3755 RepID=A0A5E4EKY1_PRUDU|nr:Hypothetical predicted protein [Prunus dulcis]